MKLGHLRIKYKIAEKLTLILRNKIGTRGESLNT